MDVIGQQAFDLGWDYATFGVDVPESANKMFCDGYRAFAGDGKRRASRPDKFIRKWLQIRFGAFSRGKPFSLQVTPEYIQKIIPSAECCPVIDAPFTYSEGKPTDWSIDRANNDRGYVRGNIIVISRFANSAKSDRSLDEIQALADGELEIDGLLPDEWRKLAQLIEPAFGDHQDEENPIPMLLGQPVALGMPISPLASFQVALSRALISGWDANNREAATELINVVRSLICGTKAQRRCFDRLTKEVIRRTRHISTYWEIWATPRVQKRLFAFITTLDGTGLTRLAELQEMTVGDHNTRIA